MNKLKPPYFAVIFTSTLSNSTSDYAEMASKMKTLVKDQPGFLGMDHARDTIGITISYWDSLESIEKWKQNNQHLKAKTLGREKWYASYSLKVCKVLY